MLVVGDYLSELEIPTLGDADALVDYPATLERLRALVAGAEHVVPGHGPVLDRRRALAVLEDDLGYVRALAERGAEAEPPARARAGSQRAAHARNVASIAA